MRKLLLFLLAITILNKYSKAQVLESDSLALIDILNNIPNDQHYSSWNMGNPVKTWKGVTLDSRGIRVIALTDKPDGSQNTIPFVMLLPSLANLTKLDTLNLRRFGGDLDVLENLTNLKYIDLEGGIARGPFPNLRALKTLTYLALYGSINQAGPMPNFSEWDLPLLKNIIIQNANLNGPIPQLYNLPNLEEFSVSDNNLSGEIPDLTNLPNLKIFAASNCNLIGGFPKIPSDINILDLSNNYLSGYLDFRQFYGKITDRFDISNNDFFGDLDLKRYRFSAHYMAISGNKFNFSTIENLLYGPIASTSFVYNLQEFFNLKKSGNFLSADSSGGTMSNNTYVWLLDGIIIKTVVGDNTLQVENPGTYYVDVTNSEISNFTMSSNDFIVTDVTLPVHISTFQATSTKIGNLIYWTTGVESNTKSFNVQVSANGKDFKDIASIQPKGSNSSYQYIDASQYQASTLYYRLAIHDNEGPISYSDIYTLKIGLTAAQISVSPNPASSRVIVKNATGLITIYGIAGKALITRESNGNETTIQVGALSPGIYYIKDGSGQNTRFIKK